MTRVIRLMPNGKNFLPWQGSTGLMLHGAASSLIKAAAPGVASADYNAIIEINFQSTS
jgi:hypothetical protein